MIMKKDEQDEDDDELDDGDDGGPGPSGGKASKKSIEASEDIFDDKDPEEMTLTRTHRCTTRSLEVRQSWGREGIPQ